MTRMGSNGASLRGRAARWGAAGAAAAAVAATGLAAAPAASAAPMLTLPVPCSVSALNAAIALSPSNTILVLASGCVYNLNSALPPVIRALTISGSNDTIRRNSGTFTIFSVLGADLTLSRLTVANGRGNGASPGALRDAGGDVTIIHSNFVGNTGGNGGAIRNDGGELTVTNSSFLRNTGTATGGAITNFAGNSNTTITSTTFAGNSAPNGGAIEVLHGRITIPPTSSTNKSVFTNNHANGITPATGFGGALDSFGGQSNVTNATFTNNSSNQDGGALWNGATSSVNGSNFRGNFARDDGGAVATRGALDLFNDNIAGNRSGDDGGGVYVTGGSTTLNKTVVTLNRAGGTGGGIRRAGGSVSLTNGTLVTLNSPNNCSPFIFGC